MRTFKKISFYLEYYYKWIFNFLLYKKDKPFLVIAFFGFLFILPYMAGIFNLQGRHFLEFLFLTAALFVSINLYILLNTYRYYYEITPKDNIDYESSNPEFTKVLQRNKLRENIKLVK